MKPALTQAKLAKIFGKSKQISSFKLVIKKIAFHYHLKRRGCDKVDYRFTLMPRNINLRTLSHNSYKTIYPLGLPQK